MTLAKAIERVHRFLDNGTRPSATAGVLAIETDLDITLTLAALACLAADRHVSYHMSDAGQAVWYATTDLSPVAVDHTIDMPDERKIAWAVGEVATLLAHKIAAEIASMMRVERGTATVQLPTEQGGEL